MLNINITYNIFILFDPWFILFILEGFIICNVFFFIVYDVIYKLCLYMKKYCYKSFFLS